MQCTETHRNSQLKRLWLNDTPKIDSSRERDLARKILARSQSGKYPIHLEWLKPGSPYDIKQACSIRISKGSSKIRLSFHGLTRKERRG